MRAGKDDEAGLLAELASVYREADEAFASWGCPASTECCRFGITGREPYVTSLELAAIRRAVAARGGPRSWKAAAPLAPQAGGRRLPVIEGSSARRATPRAQASAERTCPMLTDAGRCAIYAARPLGCRTFFCDRAEPGTPVRHRELLALVRQVQELAVRHAPAGDQGRPLTRALAKE